jgi:hypothetical protein
MLWLLQFGCQSILLVALMAAIGHSQDITIPLDGGGSIVIQSPHFITIDQFNIYEPELTFALVDNSSTAWKTLKVQFDIGAFCGGKVRQWSEPVEVTANIKRYKHTVQRLVSGFPLQGCRTEIITARIGEPPDRPGLTTEEVLEHKARREAEEAEQKRIAAEEQDREAEEQAKEAEAQAKKDAAEAARQKRLAEERRKRDVEESRRIRATCALIYKNTADKKISDLTVREEQQVRACQGLGLYPPE